MVILYNKFCDKRIILQYSLIFLIPIVVSIDLIVEYQLLWNKYQKWILPIVHAHKQYYLVILIPIAVSIDLIMEFLVKGEKEE